MLTVALFPPGATTPSLLTKATISFAGKLSGILLPPSPAMPGSSQMSQEIDATFSQTTWLSQTDTASGGQWMVQATAFCDGGYRDIVVPGVAIRESFSVQDQIHASVAPLTAAGLGPATMIDALVAGTGTLVDAFVPWPPPPPSLPTVPIVLAGSCQFAGQLQVTITLPPSSSMAPPATETFTVDLTANGLFNQVSGNA
jgi:hypothetical protein